MRTPSRIAFEVSSRKATEGVLNPMEGKEGVSETREQTSGARSSLHSALARHVPYTLHNITCTRGLPCSHQMEMVLLWRHLWLKSHLSLLFKKVINISSLNQVTHSCICFSWFYVYLCVHIATRPHATFSKGTHLERTTGSSVLHMASL